MNSYIKGHNKWIAVSDSNFITMYVYQISQGLNGKGTIMMGMHLKTKEFKMMRFDLNKVWNDEPHFHEDVYQVSIPIVGEVVIGLDGQAKRLRPGQMIIANPNVIHWHKTEKGPASFLLFGISRNALRETLNSSGPSIESEFISHQTINLAHLQQFIQSHVHPMLQWQGNELAHEDLPYRWSEYMLTTMQGNHVYTPQRSIIKSETMDDRAMDDAIQYIHGHYSEDITLDRLAVVVRMSKYHFLRSFKKATGKTPFEFLRELRLQKAVETIQISTRKKVNLTDIAYEVGFTPNQMQTLWKKRFGMTPSEYISKIQ
jgi:AraC family transcriptional regulator